MSLDVAEDLLFTKLKGLPGGTWPIAWPNDATFKTPVPKAPWMRARMDVPGGLTVTVGAQRAVQDLRGNLIVELYVPVGTGINSVNANAQMLQDWFHPRLRLASGDGKTSVRCTGPMGRVGEGELDGWFRRVISFPLMVWLET